MLQILSSEKKKLFIYFYLILMPVGCCYTWATCTLLRLLHHELCWHFSTFVSTKCL